MKLQRNSINNNFTGDYRTFTLFCQHSNFLDSLIKKNMLVKKTVNHFTYQSKSESMLPKYDM